MSFIQVLSRVILNPTQQFLGRFRLTTRLALLVRNQAEAVIRCRMGDGIEAESNGEGWLIRTMLPRDGTWIDVGAHRGAWTQLCLEHVNQVKGAVLIEPVPRYHSRLRQIIEGKPRMQLIAAAAAAAPGEATLYEDFGNGQMSSMVRDASTAKMQPRQVRVTTIDSEAASAGLDRVDLLKTDCEGFDLHALRGARGLLAAGRIGAIQFEYNAQWARAGSTLGDAFEFLGSFGYELFLLKRDGLYRLDYDRYGEFFAYSNFVALPSNGVNPALAGSLRGWI